MNNRQIGTIDARVIELLGLGLAPGTPIFVGESNKQHMRERHPDVFAKYFARLPEILAEPDYVSRHPDDGSIRYVKQLDDNVVVAVRLSLDKRVFARTIFTYEDWRLQEYKRCKYLKSYKKKTRPKARPQNRVCNDSPRQGDQPASPTHPLAKNPAAAACSALSGLSLRTQNNTG